MGRSPCCSKEGLNRGAWTALEDKILTAYIKAHGEGKWRNLPKRAGLKRCGKSCRLRWLNYLRPDIKRGNISHDEEELILRLHNLLGNRWSLIAGRLPGRTDNEIKNYWNTTLGKKARAESSSLQSKQSSKNGAGPSGPQAASSQTQVIRTKATKCTKVLFPALPPPNAIDPLKLQAHQSYLTNHYQDLDNLNMGYGIEGLDQEIYGCGLSFPNFDQHDEFGAGHDINAKENYDHNSILCMCPDQSLGFNEQMFENWTTAKYCVEDNATLDLESLTFFLDSEEWP